MMAVASSGQNRVAEPICFSVAALQGTDLQGSSQRWDWKMSGASKAWKHGIDKQVADPPGRMPRDLVGER